MPHRVLRPAYQAAYKWTLLWIILVGTLAGFAWKQGHDVDQRFTAFHRGLCVAVNRSVGSTARTKHLLAQASGYVADKAAVEKQLADQTGNPLIARIALLDRQASASNRAVADGIHLPRKGQPAFPGC